METIRTESLAGTVAVFCCHTCTGSSPSMSSSPDTTIHPPQRKKKIHSREGIKTGWLRHTYSASTYLVNNVKHPRQMGFRITYESAPLQLQIPTHPASRVSASVDKDSFKTQSNSFSITGEHTDLNADHSSALCGLVTERGRPNNVHIIIVTQR